MDSPVVYPAWYYDVTWYVVQFALPLFIVMIKTLILWELWKLLMMINFYIRSKLQPDQSGYSLSNIFKRKIPWPQNFVPAPVDMITVRSRIAGWIRRKLHLS